MARKRTKKGNVISVDFTNAGGAPLFPEGKGYHFKILEAQHKDVGENGRLNIKVECLDAENKKLIGKTTVNSFGLGETQVWALRHLLIAVGFDIPEGPEDIDLDSLVDMEFIADNAHNTYNDRTNNQFNNFITVGESSDEDEEEDEDEVVVKGKSKKAKDDEDEDEEEDEAPKKKSKRSKDEDDDEEEEDESPKSKKKSRKSKDEDEEEDEDEAPKKKSKKGTTYSEDEIRDMDEKELKSLVKKHDLDVDLGDYPSVRKKAMAVVDALEEAGLLESE